MKTCKYGCGKMKEGGKVATIKKMKVGGNTSDSCFPLCLVDGKCEKCTSTRIGDALVKAGVAVFGTKLGKDILKKRNSKKNQTAKTEAAQETVQEKRIGGATKKKYAMGGSTLVGMPKYSNNPRTDAGHMLKKGGATTSRAVSPGCRGGMVKDASGKCVNERPSFKSGGSLKPVPAGKKGLAKLPTAVRNKMGFQKKGGAVKKK